MIIITSSHQRPFVEVVNYCEAMNSQPANERVFKVITTRSENERFFEFSSSIDDNFPILSPLALSLSQSLRSDTYWSPYVV